MAVISGLINILLAILVVTGVLSGVTFAWIILIEAMIAGTLSFLIFLIKS